MCVCVCVCVCVCICANCKILNSFVASLGSLVYGGSAYIQVFLMVMMHCNGTATRGLNWCRVSHT